MKLSSSLDPQIIILASGFSRRLGQPKALARIHGRTLIAALSDKIKPLSNRPIAIVVPPSSATRRAALELAMICIDNPDRAHGLSSAVRRALAYARFTPAVLLLTIDMVALDRAAIERMLSRWRGGRRRLIARRLGQRGGIPLILPKHLFGLSKNLKGDVGLRDLFAKVPGDLIRLMDIPSAQIDIDTPQDLAAARRRL